jgi:hypothetical protein
MLDIKECKFYARWETDLCIYEALSIQAMLRAQWAIKFSNNMSRFQAVLIRGANVVVLLHRPMKKQPYCSEIEVVASFKSYSRIFFYTFT